MTGKALKDAIAVIPDDAEVVIAGPDSGGYDWVYCDNVSVEVPGILVIPVWTVTGVE